MISRSVSAMMSATEGFHPSDDGIDRVFDMLQVRAEAEDRASQVETAVDPRPAQHYAPLLLDVPDQAFVEIIDVSATRQEPEGGDGELRLRARVEPLDLRQAGMEIARQRPLLRLRCAKGGDAGDLQRQPQAQSAEMAREFR